MRVGLLTKEFPPEVYGGAGVHVGFLVPELRKLTSVDVHCFGADRGQDGVYAYRSAAELATANAALATLSTDLAMVPALVNADLAHSHTWYANFAGHLAKIMYDIPHVITAHSLEPRRPWKAEQLAGGYRLSSWVERTAYQSADAIIAVSNGMRSDILECYPELNPRKVHVVYNGIDTQSYQPVADRSVLTELGIDPAKPIVAFVGRITRQKGFDHLVAAAAKISPEAQLVFCAGAPDTPEIAAETKSAVDELAATRSGVWWIQDMLPVDKVKQILSAATVFACPSIYEPLGIVNLEAMACGTAVVASDVGGIPEVVVDGETGLLVHYDPDNEPQYRTDLAAKINELIADPTRAESYGKAGRERAVANFAWSTVAEQTIRIYDAL
jgi:starch synthase